MVIKAEAVSKRASAVVVVKLRKWAEKGLVTSAPVGGGSATGCSDVERGRSPPIKTQPTSPELKKNPNLRAGCGGQTAWQDQQWPCHGLEHSRAVEAGAGAHDDTRRT